ncbi:metalloregulator ArsR/SmtB family transcription factor [Pollutibacter soli]|uniref:ArsR/SmtB family transcription factor n=1 Tax=Pollutibacter soli TaxID=3034157 RepID=UPI003013D48A
METRRDIFQAIADPTRRAILSLLAAQALTAGAIAENFDSARQTISKHIRILSECELLTSRQQGREVYYYFNPKKLKEIDNWLEPFRLVWETRFDNIDALIKKLKNSKK